MKICFVISDIETEPVGTSVVLMKKAHERGHTLYVMDVGGFVLPELQYLYDSLVDKGLNSEIDALEVGVAIEEKDILDIDEKIIGAPSDIARAFGNLLDGSYDHLDAFNKILNQK